jgi:Co/Zn/Cd efflux system component
VRRLSFRNTLLTVAIANFVYFLFESGMALSIDSVSLFADSIDFLEDTAVNVLILVGLGWTAARRALLGRGLALLLLAPGLATLWAVAGKLADPLVPSAGILGTVGLGALLVNTVCALLLASHRREAGSLSKAAFLSARNDAIANVAIIASAFATAFSTSHWPDLIVGLGIFAMNLDASVEVWRAAHATVPVNREKA